MRSFLKQLQTNLTYQEVGYHTMILVIAFFTYFYNYHLPAAVFWDENYHIASAAKYLNGVMYMEPHPPLGKMLIALGEYILAPNSALNLNAFLETDYIKVFPNGYSFAGVRFIPTLLSMFAATLFFMILIKISKNLHLAFLFSSFYLFENALIVHSRAAMLESIQLFFIFGALLKFVSSLDKKEITCKDYGWLGFLVGLAVSVKVNGLILLLLPLFLVVFEYKDRLFNVKDIFLKGVGFIVALVAVFLVVFYLHGALGKTLAKHSSYKASAEYQTIIAENKNGSIGSFPVIMRDNLKFMKEYSAGVPRFDPCKQGENGSSCTTWPFGNKSINYRWEKRDDKVSYLYLQGNPILWFSGVLGAIFGIALVMATLFFGLKPLHKRLFFIIASFTALYLSYMIAMFNIERVMYLYHYFIPLLFSFFIAFSMVVYLFKESIERRNKIFYCAIILFVIEIIWVYIFFSPFTYYKPMTTVEFLDRMWFQFWKLAPII